MKKNDIEKMLRKNKELVPSKTLKNKVYDASLQVISVEDSIQNKKLFAKKTPFIMITTVMLIFFSVLMAIRISNEGYYTVYIDVNPSIEIIVNRFDYIVDVNYLNNEHFNIDVKKENIENTLKNILDRFKTEGYLENKEMIISLVSKDTSNSEEVLNNIKERVNDYIIEKGEKVSIEGRIHTEEEKEAAAEYNLSPAKYKIIEYLLKLEKTYTLEKLKNMSIEMLAEILNDLSGERIEEVLEKPFYPNEEKPFGDIDFDSIIIDKTKHNFVNGICTICGEKDPDYQEIHIHTEEVLAGKTATCTEVGLTEGKKCAECGEILTAQTEIPALGHKEEVLVGKAATCTEKGLTEGKKCSVCGEILKGQEEIEALGHIEEIMPGFNATCTEAGLTEGIQCSVCNKVIKEKELIMPIEHSYINGLCSMCNEKELEGEEGYNSPTIGLIYELNLYGTSYSVKFNNSINDREIIIPKKYRGLPVTSISNGAFLKAKNITNIIIPSSITNIGDNAFEGCENITNIIIPNSVINIGKNAFKECNSLTNIQLSENLSKIPQGLFYGCSNIETILIPDSVTVIGNGAFENCLNLVSIEIPNSVTIIELGVFKNCPKLESITIPFVGNRLYSSINTHFGYIFGAQSLNDNYGYIPPLLKEVVITGGISIPGESFRNCIVIEKIVLSDSITSIGESAFSTCSNLIDVTLSKNLKDIGNGAFSNCISLQNIIIPNSVTSIGSDAFSNCKSLESIEIPNSVTSIGRNAFYTYISTTIYCEILEQPDIWNNDWDKNIFGRNNVVWGYKK